MRFVLPFIVFLGTTSVVAQPGSKADSLARIVYEVAGGTEVWSRLPYIGFTYTHVIARDVSREVYHMWNRQTNQYRIEVDGPSGAPYVILFDTNTRLGEAYWAGEKLVGKDLQDQLEFANRRFVHDTFWLLAPLKLFDAGVQRSYMPDSSSELVDVLNVKFEVPGHAPAEEYLFYINKESGLLAFCVYRAPYDAPDSPHRQFAWHGYRPIRTKHGELVLSTRKSNQRSASSIIFSSVQVPPSVPEDMFTSPEPRLLSPPPGTQ